MEAEGKDDDASESLLEPENPESNVLNEEIILDEIKAEVEINLRSSISEPEPEPIPSTSSSVRNNPGGSRPPSSVCFFCLRKSRCTNSKNEDSSVGADAMTPRFIHFCQQYLKVESLPGAFALLSRDNIWGVEPVEGDFGASARFNFCHQCEKLLNSLLSIYGEMTALRARLLWSVGQLGEVLRQSTRRKSNFMKELDKFREEIEEKCRSKAQIVQPEVTFSTETEHQPSSSSKTSFTTTTSRTRSSRRIKKPRFVGIEEFMGDSDPLEAQSQSQSEPDPEWQDFGHSASTEESHMEDEGVDTLSKVSIARKNRNSSRPKRIAPMERARRTVKKQIKQKRKSQSQSKAQALQKRLIRGRKINSNPDGTPVSVRVSSHKCSHCDGEFRNRLQLLQHMAMVHEGLHEEFLRCTVCQEIQDGFFELQKHLEEKHEDPERKPIYCVFCYQSFTTQQSSDLHRREQHSKVYLARCPLLFCDKDDCPEKFMSVIDLNEHLKTHVSPEDADEGVFVCPKCGRGFLNSTRCELHSILHLRKDHEGFYHCPEFDNCQIKLKGQRKLLNHYNKKHVDMNRRLALHACDLCKKRPYFISRKDLETHSKRHALELQCRICGEVCLGSNELMVHKYNKHPEDFNFNQMPKPNHRKEKEGSGCESESALKKDIEETEMSGLLRKCVYCPQKFLTFPELEKHKAQEHGINANKPQPQRLVCDICGLVVSYKGTLARHMLTHSEPTIECPYKCGKMFRRAGNMEMHVLKAHKRGEFDPQFVCDICGRGYLSRGLLNRHKKEHEKLIKCPICSKMLRTTSRLKEHLRATHSTERFNCNWCSSEYTWETKLIAHVKKKHPEHYDDYYAGRVKWRSLTKVGEEVEVSIGQLEPTVKGMEEDNEEMGEFVEVQQTMEENINFQVQESIGDVEGIRVEEGQSLMVEMKEEAIHFCIVGEDPIA